MDKSKGFQSILIPSATVFFSSACIMIIELVAGRLTARHLGSSLYTWTSIIGVVLAGITIGNYLGGRIADKFPARKALAALFGLASAACVMIVVLNNAVGEWVWLWQLDLPVRVFCHVSVVFLVPSILLGTISPVVAKMALGRGLSTGRTVGDIYAWGAAGSIAGTFLAGYYLIAAVGTVAIIWMVAGALLLMGMLYYTKLWFLYVWFVIFVLLLLLWSVPAAWASKAGSSMLLRPKHNIITIYEDETQYCYVAVEQRSKEPDLRAFMQDKLKHSEMIMGDIADLQYSYVQIYAAITGRYARNKEKLSTLVIGGGGYVFPRYIEKMWPGSRVDVVEIDPGVTEAAMAAFGLDRNTSINTFTMDARNYVDRLLYQEKNGGEKVRYDFIYEDALNDYSVPFQLVTKEFNDKIATLLGDEGIYLIELIEVYNSGLFLGAYINTLEQTFPYVYVITTSDLSASTRNTFVVAASKRRLDLADLYKDYRQEHLYLWLLNDEEIKKLKDRADNLVITDDYAPVENLMAPVALKSAMDSLTAKYLYQAKKLEMEEKYEESLKKYQALIEVKAAYKTFAYNEMAMVYLKQGRNEMALEAYYNALGTADVPELHFSIGVLLGQMGRADKAKGHLTKAADGFRKSLDEYPDSAGLWKSYGDALAQNGQLKEASKAFAKAVRYDRFDRSSRMKLVKSLELQGRSDEAIEVLQEGIEVMRNITNGNSVMEFQQYIEHLKQKQQHPGQRQN